jgi:DNA-binding MarR family transcriptional regulator
MADDEALALWRDVQLMHLQLTAALHRGLMDDVDLSYQDFVVLAELTREPRRVVDLARTLGIEKSRLSHHLDRLQHRDLVERRPTPGDARGALVVITRAGRRLHARALPGHTARVMHHFGEHVTATEARSLRALVAKVRPELAVPVGGRGTSRP